MALLLDDSHTFPDPLIHDNTEHQGLVAVGGDLEPDQVLNAYRSGIFPWSVDPITWWSPDPRAIFERDQFHVSRSLRRRLRQQHFRITFDQAFDPVINACALRTKESTWISKEFISAYTQLHGMGFAHSVEAWDGDELVGGVYGIAVGGLFAGESMFHRRPDASKVALFHLQEALAAANFTLFDIQMLTPVTEQLGATEIPRTDYLQRLKVAVNLPCQFPTSTTSSIHADPGQRQP